MTVAEGIASILLWTINLGLACVLISWCIQRYRVDALRYRLFFRRGQLVDLVLDGTLDFGDQAYVVLRRKINNLLRFSHKISLERVLLISYFCRGPAFDEMLEADNREWEDALAALSSDEAREHVRRIYVLSLTELIKHTVFGRFWWICMEARSRIHMAKRRKARAVMESIPEDQFHETPPFQENHPQYEINSRLVSPWMTMGSEWIAEDRSSLQNVWER